MTSRLLIYVYLIFNVCNWRRYIVIVFACADDAPVNVGFFYYQFHLPLIHPLVEAITNEILEFSVVIVLRL
jgi:uncharacterized integral membrane protein